MSTSFGSAQGGGWSIDVKGTSRDLLFDPFASRAAASGTARSTLAATRASRRRRQAARTARSRSFRQIE
jgi:hypothetical protein